MKTEFKIIAHNSDEWREAVELRESILRKPPGATFTEEELNDEETHIQVVGIQKGKIVATAVLVPEPSDIKMQRVVVQSHLRSQNIGSGMMSYCESQAKSSGYERIYCHARDNAVNFYLKNGYAGEGDYFEEDGIPHLKMKKDL